MGLVAQRHVESSRTRDQTVSPALAGGFLTGGPPGKSPFSLLTFTVSSLKSTGDGKSERRHSRNQRTQMDWNG